MKTIKLVSLSVVMLSAASVLGADKPAPAPAAVPLLPLRRPLHLRPSRRHRLPRLLRLRPSRRPLRWPPMPLRRRLRPLRPPRRRRPLRS